MLLTRVCFTALAVAVLAVAGHAQTPAAVPTQRPQTVETGRPSWATRELRAGIIGTDTSHVPAFTATFASHPEWRIKVVAAFKGGSPDLPVSADRLEGFARTIQEKHGVQIVDSIEALLAMVDVVLLESVDGRPHLAQVTPVLKAGKRVFIDKPLAASLEDARRIAHLAEETKTPFFSASSYRFHPEIARLRNNPGVGKVTRVQTSSPFNVIPHHPDLYYYGIHGVEALYAVMGPGCVSVSRRVEGDADITTGIWRDGRVGEYYGSLTPGGTRPVIRVVGDSGTADAAPAPGYEPLVLAIAEFFHTGRPPVAPEETLEIFAFMSAAQVSKERGGASVPLTELRQRRDALAPALDAKAPPAPRVVAQTYIWVQHYSARGERLDDHFDEAFAATARAGFGAVQGFLTWFATPESTGTVAASLARHHLSLPAVYADGAMHDARADATIERIVERAGRAREHGVTTVIMNPAVKPDGAGKTDEELAVQARSLDALGSRLRALGMSLAVHAHDREMASGAREWYHILRHTDPAKVGICLDLHWVFRGGQDPMALLKAAGPRIRDLHLRNSRDGIWLEELSTGEIRYAEIARELRRLKFAGTYTVELAVEPTTVQTRPLEENLRRSRQFVRQTFGF